MAQGGGHFMPNFAHPRDQSNAAFMPPQQAVPNHVGQGQPPFAGVGPAGGNILQPQDHTGSQAAPRDPRARGHMHE